MSAISPLSYVMLLTFSRYSLALSLIPSIAIPIISKLFLAPRISNIHYEPIRGAFSLMSTFVILQLYSRTGIVNTIFALIFCNAGNRLANMAVASRQPDSETHNVLPHEIKPLLSASQEAHTPRYAALSQKKDAASQGICKNIRLGIRELLLPFLTTEPCTAPSINSLENHQFGFFWKEGHDLKMGDRRSLVSWTISIHPDGSHSYENKRFQ